MTTTVPKSLINNQFLYVREEQSPFTGGGSSVVGVNIRTLNTTKTNTITGASLSSNQVTLPAGTYYFEGNTPAYAASGTVLYMQSYLYNVTDTAEVIRGTQESAVTNAGQGHTFRSNARGMFTITGTKVFEMRQFVSVAVAQGLGYGATGGTVDVYSELSVWKVG